MDSFSATEFGVAILIIVALNLIVTAWLLRRAKSRALREFAAEREALNAALESLRSKSPARLPAPVEPAKSPYTRATELARNGASVAAIVEECGITRGEAELIVALHRSGISSS